MTVSPPPAPTLTWGDGVLRRDGEPYRLLSGSVHYFRVHPDQWADRLARLAAMGANTVDTYVAWNFHQPTPGPADFTGPRDLERFVRLAGEAGLDVLLRPSPYICAEWTNGAIPAWVTGQVRAQRTADPVFLAAVDAWYDDLIGRMAPLQRANGGPIVAVQVENEYGSYGNDSTYMEYLRDGLISRGIVELLTTADGTEADMQNSGAVSGAMPTFTFGSGVSRATALLPVGVPLMCGELWGGWFDHWGENHHVRSAASMMGTVDALFAENGSISLYMAHGGTNFGLWAGANHDGSLIQPTITSYDSDAPIGEDGRVNAKFAALRAAFAAARGVSEDELPALPADPTFLPEQSVALVASGDLLSSVRELEFTHPSARPLDFEELGLDAGIVAYRADVQVAAGAAITLRGLHDRAIVFLAGERIATFEHDGDHSVVVEAETAGELLILVESLGRVNYGPALGEHKGILDGVLIGRRFTHGWTHAVVPMDATFGRTGAAAAASAAGTAVATIDVVQPADAWLAFPEGRKGFVWLNGFLLGRYWERGPQVTLYAPAPLWRAGANEIVVLDVDGLGGTVEVRSEPDFGPVEEFIGT